jgi:hypothetical protein
MTVKISHRLHEEKREKEETHQTVLLYGRFHTKNRQEHKEKKNHRKRRQAPFCTAVRNIPNAPWRY